MYKHSKKSSKSLQQLSLDNNSGKTRKTRKTKKQSLLSGGGVFAITPKTYTNISYGKSKTNYITKELTCSQCKHNIFKHHHALHNSRLRAVVLDSDVLDKKYNIFVCNQCGFMMNYSGDITYTSSK
jgi:hypothetical protein